MILFFCFFFLSGFCSLVYQVVWLRIAMAAFGVTTPLVSIVLSVFMAGLALGSWGGGRLVRRLEDRSGVYFARLYGASEFAIGVSGLIVAPLLRSGRALLVAQGGQATWGSSAYYLASGAWVALILLPFCTCMGATVPLAMAAIRRLYREESPASFSFLYLANLVGALAGTLGSAFVFIELLGFVKTLLLAAAANGIVALGAVGFARTAVSAGGDPASAPASSELPGTVRAPASRDSAVLPLLFTTGLASLGMEVVWTRLFIPFMGPVVYTFATILAAYLAATALGSRIYRRWTRQGSAAEPALIWRNAAILAGVCALVPLLAVDPRTALPQSLFTGAVRVTFGVGPFCAVLGFLTSMLIDGWSAGDPSLAGRAYAVNTLGCIAGPLVSGFVLLPLVGERWTLVLLALPLFALAIFALNREPALQEEAGGTRRRRFQFAGILTVAAAVSLILGALTKDFEEFFPQSLVRRDYTATVIAAGQGMDKRLLVNGVSMTSLTPITKMMAHLPMASLASPPRNVLILCFGMGTSFRSALSWGIPVTVVDLVPSVPQLFAYFHSDGVELARSPRATIVVDDARRYLERTRETFDVIVVDPPPPIEAAGSSLLYSTEFYQAVGRHLRPEGLLAQWLPTGEPVAIDHDQDPAAPEAHQQPLPAGEPIVISAVTQALAENFSQVRAFPSVEGWGVHFLASRGAIARSGSSQLAARVPPLAARDLLEWGPAATAERQFGLVVDKEIPLGRLLGADPLAPALTDDRPVNEYYFVRRVRRALHPPVLASAR